VARNQTTAARLVAQTLGEGAKFVIVELAPGGALPVYDDHGELLKFASGKEAAAEADRLSKVNNAKYQPRPINDDKWREREEARMTKKDYLALPWAKDRWWLDLKPIWADHYPHASVQKEAFIAFTESAEKGAADIQTRIKPGRYLEQFFGKAGILSPHVIKDLCSKFSNQYEGNIIHFATTEDEIEDVYVRGPQSCMSKEKGVYPTEKHPVRGYAAGDLQVAYLIRDDRPSARFIIWPERKIYNSTGYGDTARLRPLLDKEGYKAGSVIGARLLKIRSKQTKAKDPNFSFAVPHVDNTDNHLHVDGDYLRIGAHPRDNTKTINFAGGSGVTEMLTGGCPKCDAGGAVPVRNMAVLKTSDKDDGTHAYFCATCVKKEGFKCYYSSHFVHNDHGVMARVQMGAKPQMVWKAYINKYVFMANDGEYYDMHLIRRDGKDYVPIKPGEKDMARQQAEEAMRSVQTPAATGTYYIRTGL